MKTKSVFQNSRAKSVKLALMTLVGSLLAASMSAASYDLQVEVGYEFGGCGDSFIYCANPDSGFVIIKNNGAAQFVGELRLDGIAGDGDPSHDVHDTSGAGFVLAPGATFRLEAGEESSNFGGYNKVCGGADNGLLLSIIGTSDGLNVNYQVFDKDIHSGDPRDVHAPPSLETGAPLLSDSHILQGGDPFGGDTGDDFEVSQTHAIFNVTGTSDVPCALTCPDDITVCNDPDQCGAVVNYAGPNLSGDCVGVTIACDHASGSFFPVGTTPVNCTATDEGGTVVAQCTFNVTVTETTPPTIQCPEDITVPADLGKCTAKVTFDVTTSGTCPVSVECTPPSGSDFPIGTTQVCCTATDQGGLTNTCCFNVTVTAGTKCPLSQGYWKNHTALWPVDSLTLGTVTYTKDQLISILNNPATTDASVILAKQLIAALLNIANGSNPGPICGTIADANTLLDGCNLPCKVDKKTQSTKFKAMVNDASVLERYNAGGLTPGCTP